MNPSSLAEAACVILSLLYEGRTHDEILARHPTLTRADIARACGEGLAALEALPRVETRAERILRLRLVHPRAYEPWTSEEEARLLALFGEGFSVSRIARELGRQRNAVRARLERLGVEPRVPRRALTPAPAPESFYRGG